MLKLKIAFKLGKLLPIKGNNAFNSGRGHVYFLLHQREKKEIFNMAIGNEELKHYILKKK